MKMCLLAITGSVAACKTPELVRELQKQGFDVHCLLTDAGREFVAPAALAAISGNAVLSNRFFEQQFRPGILAEPDYSHLHWAQKADLILVAPASADSIARITIGRADGVFEAAILAAKCPIIIAPAMNTAMLEAEVTQENLHTLQKRGIEILPTETGKLACGEIGSGRLLPAEEIALFTKRSVTKQSLQGKNVLITLGGTREYLDPVRFLGNASSGKMGIALATEAFLRGAKVSVIVGNVEIPLPNIFAKIEYVTSAQEMFAAAKQHFSEADITIFAAAVTDFTPQIKQMDKLDSAQISEIKLEKTIDIAAELGKVKKSHQLAIGFALETADEKTAIGKAQQKLHSKNLDAIFLNAPTVLGENETVGLLILEKKQIQLHGTKNQVASLLLETIITEKILTKKEKIS